ncbi:transcriptional regulator GlxA family with amidase domain [Chryseobacterium defluvii]|uniref:Transcriptional regulator GlxA family with amidase domain n=1 Tax=Chryseobacterium defluvii TaxID=160396 RepID=A0A840KDN8_9FLAO|nr:DJ-1/PfpI family protein [Chryseobacterium defluvii]MBB4807276.1 transcriptional regulator GlxA family with amidase domain [Chryseobacterium defluvii]
MATKFIFLLLPQVHILDIAGPDQAIHEAIDFNADFEIEYCGIGKNVVSTSGLPFGTVKHFSEIQFKKGDFLIVPGCDYSYLSSNEFLRQKELFNWINYLYNHNVAICSICTGAFVLAESGLLNGKNCTTHFKKTGELQKRYLKIKVVENILFTDQNNIYTSAGIASGIDLILHIIEKLKGSHMSHLVARELVIFSRRNGNDSQESEFLKFRNHIHTGIHKTQDFILENISRKNSLYDLAEIAAMSERNFTRIFKKETGVTVNEYINVIRKAKAVELKKNPNLSKIEIANKVGLQSEKHLSRILTIDTK